MSLKKNGKEKLSDFLKAAPNFTITPKRKSKKSTSDGLAPAKEHQEVIILQNALANSRIELEKRQKYIDAPCSEKLTIQVENIKFRKENLDLSSKLASLSEEVHLLNEKFQNEAKLHSDLKDKVKSMKRENYYKRK